MARRKNSDDPDAPEVSEDVTAPEPTDPVKMAEEEVSLAKANLAEALKAHAESDTAQAVADAQSAHDAAVAMHTELTKEPEPEFGKHILVDFTPNGTYVRRELSELDQKNFNGYPRQLFVDGVNVEQVGDHPSGVRLYRRM